MKRMLMVLSVFLCLCSCQKSLKDIVKEAEKATFIIYTYDEFGSPNGSGSGFFIDKTGIGVTNYHVLDGAVKAIIKTTDSSEYEIGQVIASDKDLDIVKFQLKYGHSQDFPTLRFAKKEAEKGEVVYNISSPLGLEHSISEGIVSSVRDDKQHGKVIQVTAPISPGSSGSALLNERGEVIAVATFQRGNGQNLNFGVAVDSDMIEALAGNDFVRANPKFNLMGDSFVILNIPATKDPELVLNAIEFGNSATTLYMTYTNLNLAGGDSYGVWVELNKKEQGFLIQDLERNMDYYVTSSTLGADKNNYTEVPLATSSQFKVYLPAINNLKQFSIYGCGKEDSRWQFLNIDLDKYRNELNINPDSYQRDYALSIMREGELGDAQSILLEWLDSNPDDVNSLTALGIISYVIDNNSDALYYLTEAIEKNPNNSTAYVNRHSVHKYQKDYASAIADLTKAIDITPDQPDHYIYRATAYMDIEQWANAKSDLDKAIESEDFKRDAMVYLYRVYTNAHLEKWREACRDIQTAYNLTDNEDMEKELEKLWDECGCR